MPGLLHPFARRDECDSTSLFQRQKQLHDSLVCRYLRNARERASAIDREVTGLLAAGGKPLAVKEECGGLEVVRVAWITQHRAASARDQAGLRLHGVRFDRMVGRDTQIRTVVVRVVRTPLRTEDHEGGACLGRQARGLAPGEEPLAAGAERRAVAPMLDDRHRCRRHLADGYVVFVENDLHELVPRVVEWPEGRKPRR